QVLWLISDYLEQIEDIHSLNESFEFSRLTITSKPFINEADEQGWFVFLLDFQVKLTTFKEEQQHD
ncbi:capsid protein, partial [Enterococcus faecium]|nr:capsid protein [Enterococcus faecium]